MFEVCGLRVSGPPSRLDKGPRPDTQGSTLFTTAQQEGARRAGPGGIRKFRESGPSFFPRNGLCTH